MALGCCWWFLWDREFNKTAQQKMSKGETKHERISDTTLPRPYTSLRVALMLLPPVALRLIFVFWLAERGQNFVYQAF